MKTAVAIVVFFLMGFTCLALDMWEYSMQGVLTAPVCPYSPYSEQAASSWTVNLIDSSDGSVLGATSVAAIVGGAYYILGWNTPPIEEMTTVYYRLVSSDGMMTLDSQPYILQDINAPAGAGDFGIDHGIDLSFAGSSWGVLSCCWLDVTIAGNGTLNVGDGWQSAGTTLTITATPDSGWLFMGWSGDVSGDYTHASTNLLMDDINKSVTATFSSDADEDGLTNTEEDSHGTDPRDSDSDDDSISDYLEVTNGLNPLISNVDVDSDTDGLFDADEVLIHHTDPLDNDSDDDGLTDGEEISIYTTDSLDDDTDDDLIIDGDEVDNSLNPLVSNAGLDSDNDGVSDQDEVNIYGTDPLVPNVDNPVVGAVSLEREALKVLRFAATNLLMNTTDPGSNAVYVASVASTSAQGYPVSTDGYWVFYSPTLTYSGEDSFTFTVTNSVGGTAEGLAMITVSSSSNVVSRVNITSLTSVAENAMNVGFVGVPGREYTVQFTESLTPPAWTNVGTGTFGALGSFTFTHTNAPPSGFYRTTQP